MRRLILFLALCLPVWSALPSNTIWEIRSAGASTNAGCFASGGTGTDYSQQDGAQFSGTDLVIDGTDNTVVTSATHNFVSTDVDNCLRVNSGTGFTAGVYRIVSTATNAATLDRAVGTTGSTGGNWAVGGATGGSANPLASVTGNVVAGNIIYIRNGSYTVGTSQVTTVAGTSGSPITWIGYNTDRTDGGSGGRPTFTSNATTVTNINLNTALNRVKNLNIDCNSQSSSRGLSLNVTQQQIENVHVSNCTTSGILSGANGQTITNSSATGCSALPITITTGTALLVGVRSYANTTNGFTNSGGFLMCVRCISDGNTGASSDGFQHTATATSTGTFLLNSAAYNNGRDGFRATAAASADSLAILNSVFVNNAGYGINSATTDYAGKALLVDYNGYYGNGTEAINQLPTGANDVTLSGDPFVNAVAGNFALDNTASEGAALRGVGFPGALTSGGTGYLDIGPLQHQDAGGSGSTGGAFTFVQ